MFYINIKPVSYYLNDYEKKDFLGCRPFSKGINQHHKILDCYNLMRNDDIDNFMAIANKHKNQYSHYPFDEKSKDLNIINALEESSNGDDNASYSDIIDAPKNVKPSNIVEDLII